MITVTFASMPKNAEVIVYPLFKGDLKAAQKGLSKNSAAILEAKAETRNFEGDAGQILGMDSDVPGQMFAFVGLGDAQKIKTHKLEELGGKLYDHLKVTRAKEIFLSGALLGKDAAKHVAHLAFGVQLKSYRFDEFKTTLKPKDVPVLKKLVVDKLKGAAEVFEPLSHVSSSIAYVRDLVNLPPNILNPVTYAERIKELKALGLKITVLDEKELKKMGMHTMLGVGQGSATLPRLVSIEWHGGKKGDAPIALVGKGVTFDSGGYSLKPSTGMETMKADMAGSAIVVGSLRTLALRKAKINVVGVVALVENMVDANAQRVSDVVKSYKGLTVEVLNTDAEGRLILADALTYTDKHFKPKKMLDFATLTGAIIVSLGHEHAGLFSRDDKLCEELLNDGLESGEKLWRLPLTEDYESHIISDVADIKNIGVPGSAGSISAAEFLRRFVDDKTPWAHLDVAGVEMSSKESALSAKGATGYGLRLMHTWLSRYEG